MSTSVYYNGVHLSNVRTLKFDQTNVYDDSGTDLLYHKFVVRVRGFLHDSQVAAPSNRVWVRAGGVGTGSPPRDQREVRKRLMENRKAFEMLVGNVTLLRARGGYDPVNGIGDIPGRAMQQGELVSVDLNNGPKPLSCSITNVVGVGSLIVEFEIEICALECTALSNTTGILSNRWGMQDTYDENWYTTRTIRGRIRVTNPYLPVADFAQIVVPDLQPGFRRASIDFVVAPDGLTMDYTVTDKQFFIACPNPARTWSVTHEAHTENGFTHVESVHITLDSDARSNKFFLFALAMEIADSRLGFTTGRTHLRDAHVINYVDQNKVELHISTFKIGDEEGTSPGNKQAPTASPYYTHVMKEFKLIPGKSTTANYNPQFQEPPSPYGNSGIPLTAFVCYLQSPCDYKHGPEHGVISLGGKEARSKKGNGKEPKINGTLGELPADPDRSGNFDRKQTNYTHYEIQTDYAYQQNLVALPIARAAGTSANQRPGTSTASHTFIQMAPKTCRRRVVVNARRYGKTPDLPSPNSFEANGKQMMAVGDMIVRHKAPVFSADMDTMIYEVECEYQFASSHMLGSSDPLVLGVTPFDARKAAHSQVAPTFFKNELIGNVRVIG